MENPFDTLEKKINQRLDSLEALIKENVKPVRAFRIGGMKLAEEVTGLSSHAIYRLVEKRKIPFSRPTGTRNLRFDEEKLIEWLKSGHQATAEEIESSAFRNLH